MDERKVIKPSITSKGILPKRVTGLLPWRKWSIKKSEIVYMPFYIFKCEGNIILAVDALMGIFRLFPENVFKEFQYSKEIKGFDFMISPLEAYKIAEKEITIHIPVLKRRGLNIGKIDKDPERILYPFWVFYLERKEKIKVYLVDAVTGAPGGPKLLRAFFKAIQRPSS